MVIVVVVLAVLEDADVKAAGAAVVLLGIDRVCKRVDEGFEGLSVTVVVTALLADSVLRSLGLTSDFLKSLLKLFSLPLGGLPLSLDLISFVFFGFCCVLPECHCSTWPEDILSIASSRSLLHSSSTSLRSCLFQSGNKSTSWFILKKLRQKMLFVDLFVVHVAMQTEFGVTNSNRYFQTSQSINHESVVKFIHKTIY